MPGYIKCESRRKAQRIMDGEFNLYKQHELIKPLDDEQATTKAT